MCNLSICVWVILSESGIGGGRLDSNYLVSWNICTSKWICLIDYIVDANWLKKTTSTTSLFLSLLQIEHLDFGQFFLGFKMKKSIAFGLPTIF